MTTITFDTLKFVERLKSAGITDEQAKAFSDAFKDAQGEADFSTKQDILDVRRDMREMEQRLIIKLGGMMVVAIAVIAALVKLL